MIINYAFLETEFGTIYVAANENGICKVAVTHEDWYCYTQERRCSHNSNSCSRIVKELTEYLRGDRLQFTVPVSIGGTPFYRKVWQELCKIPYGQTRTYTDIAAAVGSPKAYRAVGRANFQNPVPIIIPCHRVVGKRGNLTGYKGASIYIKEYLLDLENQHKMQQGEHWT